MRWRHLPSFPALYMDDGFISGHIFLFFFIVLELPCITFSHVCTQIVKLIDNLSESESGSGYVEANPKGFGKCSVCRAGFHTVRSKFKFGQNDS